MPLCGAAGCPAPFRCSAREKMIEGGGLQSTRPRNFSAHSCLGNSVFEIGADPHLEAISDLQQIAVERCDSVRPAELRPYSVSDRVRMVSRASRMIAEL